MNEEQQSLTFVPYTPAYRQAFFDLNAAWLNAYFLLEPFDIEVLSDPEKMVIKPGGAIYVGLLNGEAIATFALTPKGEGKVELNKMAVEEEHRGTGVGHQMMDFILRVCREREVHTLELYSHTSLKPAIHLYEKYGFETIPLSAECVYDRADIRMQLTL
ncbi:MAG: GNAT family N-acetyltransferase [Flavobacteriales bacterium]|nr:GNAT family N-acetyltransferase [Flavobacteriales bacterium]